ncbi:hypothetical protein predicted by Glimmer/Critica [Sorangium cellulosum So ce56]|uniref:Uncharacterized protein n=1 Tax=Sorangium cellulosum (strain So ce56) TaxID=448385 RepID=A9EVS3_SORC5|nr:hypothetical protein [Sorangium cellulosum]CAN94252.1 hypothetical protein predicted by Glimmer/Critica [Sorangium cellulosum So ce56]
MRARLRCCVDRRTDEIEIRAARVLASDRDAKAVIARVRDHAPDTGQHLVAPRAELRGDLAIRERHGEVDPREPGARRGVALRHPTPRYRLSALEGLADRRHGLHLDRPHHRDARLDLVDPGPLERARSRPSPRREGHARRLLAIEKGAVIHHARREISQAHHNPLLCSEPLRSGIGGIKAPVRCSQFQPRVPSFSDPLEADVEGDE